MLKKIKALGKWAEKKLTSPVTADEVIELFKKERVHKVILELACYWRPSIKDVFVHTCVIGYVGMRAAKKPIRRKEVLLSIKGRITNERIKNELINLSPIVYNRVEEILDGVPGVRVGIDNEYMKALGNKLYVLPQKKVGRI